MKDINKILDILVKVNVFIDNFTMKSQLKTTNTLRFVSILALLLRLTPHCDIKLKNDYISRKKNNSNR